MKHLSIRYISDVDFRVKLDKILSEYKSGQYSSILFHIYSGVNDEKLLMSISGKIGDLFETDNIVGSISAGEIKNGRLMDRGVLVSVMMFESAEIKVFRFENASGSEQDIGKQIRSIAASTTDCKALELMLPGTNLHTRLLFEEVSRCRRGIQVFGGYAGGHSMESSEHFVFDRTGLYGDLIFLITYAGAELHVSVDKSVGWQTLGVPFSVTKADENRLITVDGRPAAELYQKYMQIETDENFAEATFEFPLMAELGDEELLRHTISVDDDGSLILAGYVTEGMKIYLCYGAPAEIVKRVDARLLEICEFRPQAILLYSCSVRKSFWEDFVNVEMMPFQKIAETAGFHTWGEINRDAKGNVLEYNITLLSIAMREGPAEGDVKHVHVDDSVLKGQASLIKRLTKLVYATTTELHRAYTDLSEMNDKLKEMAEHDGLTGVLNRRSIEEKLTAAFNSEDKTPNGLLMLDIDFFKKVNDTYGHKVGDDTLTLTAKIMSDSVKDIEGAYVGRWGGEEFMLLVPGYDADKAFELSEQIRTTVEQSDYGAAGHITVSLGSISFDGSEDLTSIYTSLDDALYKAKNSGRNKCCKAEPLKKPKAKKRTAKKK
ncbi:MAG: GGDEF domain-containing protein [Ruminococcus sp.]|nr:GGDEF domain-containing protein [Ruminococcus sp.]